MDVVLVIQSKDENCQWYTYNDLDCLSPEAEEHWRQELYILRRLRRQNEFRLIRVTTEDISDKG